jgi:linoleoyl-CoA desaturase
LLTFNWAIMTDFRQTSRYMRRKLSYGKLKTPKVIWTTLLVTKALYAVIWIAVPIVTGVVWWKVLLGFFVMHYTAGLILSVVFQLAHVVEETDNPIPDENGALQHSWAVHQLYTTANFAPRNRFINWFTGGLNNQIEHHLFPHISHVHYRKISKIIKETAQECRLPYHEFDTMRGAVAAHFRHLKALGAKPALA